MKKFPDGRGMDLLKSLKSAHRSPRRIVAGAFVLSALPFLIVEMFPAQFKIVMNARMMGLLIDDLLNFSRLGRQEVMKVELDEGATFYFTLRGN
jgi:hypothetical protein